MKAPTEGQLPITFWAPASLKLAADAVAKDRELSMAQYLRQLMHADIARRQSQREDNRSTAA
jgi:hypothetical protein